MLGFLLLKANLNPDERQFFFKLFFFNAKVHANAYAIKKIIKRQFSKKTYFGLSYLLIVPLSLILDLDFVSPNFFLCLG